MSFHHVQPVPETIVREEDGQPGDLMATQDYPVLGDCMGCGGRIRLRAFFYPVWEHVDGATHNLRVIGQETAGG